MLAKRIIPCLDVKDGKVVKGVHFENLRDAGDPVDNAAFYSAEGADELVFLDISATIEGRRTMRDIVRGVAAQVSIPFTVGGGIRTVEDILALLQCGADKVSINTRAVTNPAIIGEGAKKLGSQCIVVAIDAKETAPGTWKVYVESGKTPTDLDAVEWAKRVEDLGAGEILLTSIDADGTQKGYDIRLTRRIAERVKIPVIASGGAGSLDHLYDVLSEGKASAVLMASLLHFRVFTIAQIKEFLDGRGIVVRR
jgi:imidazole glycerol-phosphate synthase subunit HisF